MKFHNIQILSISVSLNSIFFLLLLQKKNLLSELFFVVQLNIITLIYRLLVQKNEKREKQKRINWLNKGKKSDIHYFCICKKKENKKMELMTTIYIAAVYILLLILSTLVNLNFIWICILMFGWKYDGLVLKFLYLCLHRHNTGYTFFRVMTGLCCSQIKHTLNSVFG